MKSNAYADSRPVDEASPDADELSLEEAKLLLENNDEIIGGLYERGTNEAHCRHEVVDEDANCLCCSADVPLSWMYDEYTQVVTNPCSCENADFVQVIDTESEVVRLECEECSEVLSFKSSTSDYYATEVEV